MSPVLTDGVVTLRAHRLSDVDEELGFAIQDGVREFAGAVSLRLRGDGIADIAYDLQPAARGRGVCTRAVRLVLDWGFQQPEIDVVTWYAPVGDWAARRVAWANGFRIGTTIEKFRSCRGVRVDCWTGSLRADDSREPTTPWHIPPVLETDRLRLRPLRESDADRFGEMVTDERTQRFFGRYLADGQVSASTRILRQLDRNARGEGHDWCIADPETDQLIGHIHLWNLGGFDPTSAELGYSVHPDARGRGVLTESLGLVVDWAFLPVADGGPGFRRLSLGTAASNAASRHAAEKAGFTHISSEPAAFPTGESGFEDMAIYHRLNQKWTP